MSLCSRTEHAPVHARPRLGSGRNLGRIVRGGEAGAIRRSTLGKSLDVRMANRMFCSSSSGLDPVVAALGLGKAERARGKRRAPAPSFPIL